MKDKQIIENKLEILLKEYRITEDRLKRLKPIIETYASRYISLTGESYTTTQIDRAYDKMKDER